MISKNDLLEYQRVKEESLEIAERALRGYFEFRKWNIPSDICIDDIDVYPNLGLVYIRYYGFQDFDTIAVPIEYFITLDKSLLR